MKSGAEGSTKTPAGSSAAATAKSPTEPFSTVRRTASTTATQGTKSTPKAASSPARPRVARAGAAASPTGRKSSSSKEVNIPSPTLKRAATTLNKVTQKKVFSPVRDPHGNSGSIGDISGKLKLNPRF